MIMKSKNLLFLVAILLTILAVPSCNFVNVDTPVTNDIQKYRILGTVQTADQSIAIEGAKVILGNLETITNAEGKYAFESTTSFATGTEIFVSKEGYINSFINLSYGDEAPIEYSVDFNLTRALPAGFVDLSQGGELVFEDVTVSIPGGNSATLDGETMTVVQLSVTPLNPISSFGSFTGATMKTLIFNPIGMEFSKPVTISFQVPEGFSTSSLMISQFNTETNAWEATDITVDYNASSATASFQVKGSGIYRGVNPGSLVIQEVQNGLIENVIYRYTKSTCECEGPTPWVSGAYVKNYDLVTTSIGANADYYELRAIQFFGQGQVQAPWSPLYIPGHLGPYWPGWPVSSVFTTVVGDCEEKEVIFYRMYKQVTGYYEWAGEYKSFVFKFYYGVTPMIYNIIPCTVHNGCHQGCGPLPT
jgi:hypothetical protein